MNPLQKLDKLRCLMALSDFDAYIIPGTDPHMDEYMPECWQTRSWFSGFTGSAGTLVITTAFAGLWTDSRYFLQAESELKGSGIELVKLRIPHTPEYVEWIAKNLPAGSRVGVDGKMISVDAVRYLKSAIAQKQMELVTDEDLISPLWTDRPSMPMDLISNFDTEYSGLPRTDKINLVRNELQRLGASHHLISSLDDIAWLLNLRGTDIEYNPLFISYVLITPTETILFVNEVKVTPELRETLSKDGVTIRAYDDIEMALSGLMAGSRLLLAPGKINQSLVNAIKPAVSIVEGSNPTTYLKAIKNDTEINYLRKAMVDDGVALVKFFYWLENNLGKERITEISAADKLQQLRSEQNNFKGLSFATIAGYAAHGAIVHYDPTPETDVELKPEGLFLLDSGGQFLSGTTDITRTIALGVPTEEQKRDFTLALKGTISLCDAVFPEGTRGYQLDAIARIALWKNGMNFGHGTGHGVGFYLNVHEGPQSISPNGAGPASTILERGMVTSVEPGLYREGKHGIRTENLVLCVPYLENEFGSFLRFETLTLCPIDRNLIDESLLDKSEIEWLNSYHAVVNERLAAFLSDAERKWLCEKTAVIGLPVCR
ncbi:MAG: aminopeptidase P family protein [Bacteroidota bacterium]|nr:aminopeptidase P family protein [Bacteroidota bacterium]